MCLGAIYWARLSRVFCGCTKVDAGEAGFSDDFIYKELDKPNGERRLVQHFLLHAEAGDFQGMGGKDRQGGLLIGLMYTCAVNVLDEYNELKHKLLYS